MGRGGGHIMRWGLSKGWVMGSFSEGFGDSKQQIVFLFSSIHFPKRKKQTEISSKMREIVSVMEN